MASVIQVKVLAVTQLVDFPEGYIPHEDDWPTDADELAEIAGRMCYQSWNRPNPSTATNEGYLANIKRQRHWSVIEHGNVTVEFRGCSRNFTHELVRHRHFSFSQLSQRYVDGRDSIFVGHPALGALGGIERGMVDSFVERSRDVYGILVDELEKKGLSHKHARQAARQVLPGGMETRIIVTGNHRTWREMIEKRNSPAADEEFQEAARAVLKVLFPIAPNIYSDLTDGLLEG